MPSLIRFLSILATIVAVAFASLHALATFVSPRTREMTVTIPSHKLKAPPPQSASRDRETAVAGQGAGQSAGQPASDPETR